MSYILKTVLSLSHDVYTSPDMHHITIRSLLTPLSSAAAVICTLPYTIVDLCLQSGTTLCLYTLSISVLSLSKMLRRTGTSYVVAYLVDRQDRHIENANGTGISKTLHSAHIRANICVPEFLTLAARSAKHIFTSVMISTKVGYEQHQIWQCVKCTTTVVPYASERLYRKCMSVTPTEKTSPF